MQNPGWSRIAAALAGVLTCWATTAAFLGTFASIPENVSTIFVFAVSASLLAAVMAGRRPRQAGVLAVVLLLLLFQLIAATVYFFAVSSGGV
jgi:asparagine N-glycosylation enzyme membrane subunit Stt3